MENYDDFVVVQERRARRTSKKQLETYCSFLKRHPNFINNFNKIEEDDTRLWTLLAEELNSVDGPKRNADKWTKILKLYKFRLEVTERRIRACLESRVLNPIEQEAIDIWNLGGDKDKHYANAPTIERNKIYRMSHLQMKACLNFMTSDHLFAKNFFENRNKTPEMLANWGQLTLLLNTVDGLKKNTTEWIQIVTYWRKNIVARYTKKKNGQGTTWSKNDEQLLELWEQIMPGRLVEGFVDEVGSEEEEEEIVDEIEPQDFETFLPDFATMTTNCRDAAIQVNFNILSADSNTSVVDHDFEDGSEKTCRTCLSKDSVLYFNIYINFVSMNNTLVALSDLLVKHFDVRERDRIDLPTAICRECKDEIIKFAEFKQKSRNTDLILHNNISVTPKKECEAPKEKKDGRSEKVTIEFLDFYDDSPFEKVIEKNNVSSSEDESEEFDPPEYNFEPEKNFSENSDNEPSTSFKNSKVKTEVIKEESEGEAKVSECFVKIETLDPSDFPEAPKPRKRVTKKIDCEESEDDEPLIKNPDSKSKPVRKGSTKSLKDQKLCRPRHKKGEVRQSRAEKDKRRKEVINMVFNEAPYETDAKTVRYCKYCKKMLQHRLGPHYFEVHFGYHEIFEMNMHLFHLPQCTPCRMIFVDEEALEKHNTDTNHPEEKLQTEVELLDLEQVLNSGKEYDYKCSVCPAVASTLSEMTNHMMAIHCKHFKCPIADCFAEFALWTRFGQHFSHRHSLKCLNCKTPQFDNISKLMEHKKYECSARSDPCDHCGKIFASPYNLQNHLKMLNMEKKFICQYCAKAFTTERAVTNHTKIHTGDRPFKCKLCSKSFMDFSSRSIHMESHVNRGTYKCHLCEKAYSTSALLKAHLKQHLVGPQMQCRLCPMKFSTSWKRNHHLKKVHCIPIETN